MPFHLVLVHGTGASGAKWTRADSSSLCQHLTTALGEPPSFSHADWSGRNTHQDRADGARKLIEHVEDKNQVPADRPLVLVGHSHGGSVIAQALVADEGLCRRVAGVVFLSTPFLHARLLPLAKHLPKGLALLAAAAACIGTILGVIALSAIATDWPQHPNPWLTGAVVASVFAGLFTGGVVFDLVSRRLGTHGQQLTPAEAQAVARLLEPLDLGALERRDVNRRSLLVRSTADEAAGALATVQLMGRIASDLPALTWKAPGWVTRELVTRAGFRGGKPPRWFWTLFFACTLAGFVGLSVALAAWLLPDCGPIQSLDDALREAAHRVVRAGAHVLVGSVWVVFFVCATAGVLLLIGAPFKLLSRFAYGLHGWPMLRGMFVELSVEPAPPGSWRVHQLDANGFEPAPIPSEGREEKAASTANDETAWAHSYVYDDARAHRLIAQWLRSGCDTRETGWAHANP